jgi:hypothetical protein
MNLVKFLPFTNKSNVGSHDTVLVKVPYCALIGSHLTNVEIVGVEIKPIVVGDKLICTRWRAEYDVLYVDEKGFLLKVIKLANLKSYREPRHYLSPHSQQFTYLGVGARVWEDNAAFPSEYERF